MIADTATSLLVLLWVYAALSKWLDFDLFVAQLQHAHLPSWMAIPLSTGIPLVELTVAGLLLHQRSRNTGLIASVALLVLFTGYIAIMLAGDKKLPCSCGGVLNALSWEEHLLFNAAFIVIGLVGLCSWHTKIHHPRSKL